MQAVCGAGWGGMCNCVMAWRGRREARNARRARVPVAALRYRLTSVGEPAVCVCVCLCATQPGAGCGGVGAACEEAAGKKGESARDATWAAVDHRMRSAVCVRPPG